MPALKRFIYLLSALIFLFQSSSLCGDNKHLKKPADAVTTCQKMLDLTNFSTYILDRGTSDHTPEDLSGLMFPKGSGKTCVYSSGFLFGAKVNGQIRLSGSTYLSNLTRGWINSNGKAEDTTLPINRIYRVRPDYKFADLRTESLNEGKSESVIRSEYEKDWEEWPADKGAPFVDINKNGKYDPFVDIPGIKDAAQTIWSALNDLDTSLSNKIYGADPLGIEIQAAYWTYDKNWIVNNLYFKKFKIINKSSTALTDAYTCLWTDPDIGDPIDDYAGCDTLLNMGFVYNSNNNDYNYLNNPPSAGFMQVQGPVVKAIAGQDRNKNGIDDIQETAAYNGKRTSAGFINLPMTAFFILTRDAVEETIVPVYDQAVKYYYNFQGKRWPGGQQFSDPQGHFTNYVLNGNPLTNSGWIDGQILPPGDRRIGIPSGPFNMAPGDTQEVVYAQIIAQSNNNLNSVRLLKSIGKQTALLGENLFNFSFPPAPYPPETQISGSDNEITIKWNQDDQIENFDKEGLKFQGYNVYQLPSSIPDKRHAVKIAVWDKIDGITKISGEETDTLSGDPVISIQQNGNDYGIQRILRVDRDTLEHSPLLAGKTYYFAVTAYTYKPDSTLKLTNSESEMKIIKLTFRENFKGYHFKDTIEVKRTSGRTDAAVVPEVQDGTRLTGHTYQIGFNSVNDTLSWFLRDVTENKFITKNELDFSGNYNSPVYDGVKIRIKQAPKGMKGWEMLSGQLKWTPLISNQYSLEGFGGAIGNAYDHWFSSRSSVDTNKLKDVLLKFASTDTSGNLLDPNDPNVSFAYRYLRSANSSPARPEFTPFIINKDQGYPFQDFKRNFPFAAFDMETVPPRRLAVGYLENNVLAGSVDGKYWPPDALAGISNTEVYGPREFFFIFDTDYKTIPEAALQGNIYRDTLPVIWFGTPARAGHIAFDKNDQFLIKKYREITPADTFYFNTKYIKDIFPVTPVTWQLNQNFPNPFNIYTVITFYMIDNGFVKIEVYDILGRKIKELINADLDPGIHYVNFSGNGLPSGIYIYRLNIKNKYSDVKKMLLLK